MDVSRLTVADTFVVTPPQFTDEWGLFMAPCQAKYVTFVGGSFLDFVVDVRVGNPTFGQWDSAVLDTRDRRAVYVPEGVGHALFALEDDSTALFHCSTPFVAGRERALDPLDPGIGLELPDGLTPVVSPKDADAPSLAEARAAGLLPSYAACRARYDELAQHVNASD